MTATAETLGIDLSLADTARELFLLNPGLHLPILGTPTLLLETPEYQRVTIVSAPSADPTDTTVSIHSGFSGKGPQRRHVTFSAEGHPMETIYDESLWFGSVSATPAPQSLFGGAAAAQISPPHSGNLQHHPLDQQQEEELRMLLESSFLLDPHHYGANKRYARARRSAHFTITLPTNEAALPKNPEVRQALFMDAAGLVCEIGGITLDEGVRSERIAIEGVDARRYLARQALRDRQVYVGPSASRQGERVEVQLSSQFSSYAGLWVRKANVARDPTDFTPLDISSLRIRQIRHAAIPAREPMPIDPFTGVEPID